MARRECFAPEISSASARVHPEPCQPERASRPAPPFQAHRAVLAPMQIYPPRSWRCHALRTWHRAENTSSATPRQEQPLALQFLRRRLPRVLRAAAFTSAPLPTSLSLRSAKPPPTCRPGFELVPQPESLSVPLLRPFAPATMLGVAPLALRVWAYANGRRSTPGLSGCKTRDHACVSSHFLNSNFFFRRGLPENPPGSIKPGQAVCGPRPS